MCSSVNNIKVEESWRSGDITAVVSPPTNIQKNTL